MSAKVRIDFRKDLQIPEPWKVFDTDGTPTAHIGSSFTLIRIPSAVRSASGRAMVRAALDEELRRIAGGPVRWRESPTGPKVLDRIEGNSPTLSVSYTKSEAWLAVCWDGPIGVDATSTGGIAEWESLAELYLGAEALGRLRRSTDSAADFAREWSTFEARLKLYGRPLSEGSPPPDSVLCTADFDTLTVSVALDPCPTRPGQRPDKT
jgi:hypothetical protein